MAPFDGVITQRNVDNGSLVQAGSTFMFTLMHSNVIRTQVFVPQDEAFGVAPGVDADIRVPEIPADVSGESHTHRKRIAAGKPDSADRDRRAQSGRCFESRYLLHGRAVDPAQDAVGDSLVRCARLRSKRSSCRGRAERHRSSAARLDRTGLRHHGGSARGATARRPGRAQSVGEPGGGQQGHHSQGRG
ncbi:HlyD family efflux transporter periplasmic adaptor subunit [Bradyrhizobium japonicum]